MADTVVRVGGSGTVVQVRGGAARRVTLDRSTIAKIDAHRPVTQPIARPAPVNVVERDTLVRTGGGMGVQGRSGRDGQSGDSIAPIAFAYGDAPHVLWIAPSAGLLTYVRVVVRNAFDGIGAELTLGTSGDPESAMPAAYSDVTVVAEYENTPDVHLAAGEPLLIVVSPGASATRGDGLLLLQFLPD